MVPAELELLSAPPATEATVPEVELSSVLVPAVLEFTVLVQLIKMREVVESAKMEMYWLSFIDQF